MFWSLPIWFCRARRTDHKYPILINLWLGNKKTKGTSLIWILIAFLHICKILPRRQKCFKVKSVADLFHSYIGFKWSQLPLKWIQLICYTFQLKPGAFSRLANGKFGLCTLVTYLVHFCLLKNCSYERVGKTAYAL